MPIMRQTVVDAPKDDAKKVEQPKKTSRKTTRKKVTEAPKKEETSLVESSKEAPVKETKKEAITETSSVPSEIPFHGKRLKLYEALKDAAANRFRFFFIQEGVLVGSKRFADATMYDDVAVTTSIVDMRDIDPKIIQYLSLYRDDLKMVDAKKQLHFVRCFAAINSFAEAVVIEQYLASKPLNTQFELTRQVMIKPLTD